MMKESEELYGDIEYQLLRTHPICESDLNGMWKYTEHDIGFGAKYRLFAPKLVDGKLLDRMLDMAGALEVGRVKRSGKTYTLIYFVPEPAPEEEEEDAEGAESDNDEAGTSIPSPSPYRVDSAEVSDASEYDPDDPDDPDDAEDSSDGESSYCQDAELDEDESSCDEASDEPQAVEPDESCESEDDLNGSVTNRPFFDRWTKGWENMLYAILGITERDPTKPFTAGDISTYISCYLETKEGKAKNKRPDNVIRRKLDLMHERGVLRRTWDEGRVVFTVIANRASQIRDELSRRCISGKHPEHPTNASQEAEAVEPAQPAQPTISTKSLHFTVFLRGLLTFANSSPFTSSQLKTRIEGLSTKYVCFQLKKMVDAAYLQRSLKKNNSTNGHYMYKLTTRGEAFIRASVSQFQPMQTKPKPSARDLMKAAAKAKAAPLAPKTKKKSKPSIPSNLKGIKRKFPFEQPHQKRVRKYQSRRRRYRPAMHR